MMPSDTTTRTAAFVARPLALSSNDAREGEAMSPKAINQARHQQRRENVGKRLKICAQCSKRLGRHSADGQRLCCIAMLPPGISPPSGIPNAWRLPRHSETPATQDMLEATREAMAAFAKSWRRP